MKERILIIILVVCLVFAALSSFFYIKEHSSYKKLHKLYSKNVQSFEEVIFELNDSILYFLEKMEEDRSAVDYFSIINSISALDLLQRYYSIMIHDYYTYLGSDLVKTNINLDYRSGLIFYKNILSYIKALQIDHSTNNFILSENDLKKIEDIKSLLKSLEELYAPLKEPQFSELSEKDKMRQRVKVQADFCEKLPEINSKTSDLLK